MPLSGLQPILTISYADDVRSLMAKTLQQQGAVPASCASFCEAESLALMDLYSGVLVDIPSMVKAKGEEKIVSCSLGNVFPILRVRLIGAMLIPMVLSGGASQDKSLMDFLSKTCASYVPRRLRAHKRHLLHTPVLLSCDGRKLQGFSYDLSWGGAFVATNRPDRFMVGGDVGVSFSCYDVETLATVCRVQPWGHHGVVPGIGLRWHKPMSEGLEQHLKTVLRTSRDHDRDRIVG